jgi:hypothetical protein
MRQHIVIVYINAVWPTINEPGRRRSYVNYIFTIIDHTSKWMEAIPLSETSVAACAKALTFNWISRFGVCVSCECTTVQCTVQRVQPDRGHHCGSKCQQEVRQHWFII